MRDYLNGLIEDTICTGDMVTDKYSDGMTFWNNVVGAENILMCIGNHDVTDGTDYNEYCITTGEAYAAYFAPYIANWGVVHSGSLTYYYKDYPANKVRLIAMDYLLTGTDAVAQNTWLQSVLSDAKTNDYTVVIMEHVPLPNNAPVDCGFNMINNPWTYNQFASTYQDSVQAFINGGGKFACYLSGHAHGDLVGYNENYPEQLCITITCATTTGRDNDQMREVNTKSQDAANICMIDTAKHTIQLIRIGANMDCYLRPRSVLTISYTDKAIIADY
jgi:hypothetical protein